MISAACVGAWVVQRVQARARIELQTRLTCEQVAIRLEEAIRARIAVAEGVRELIQVGEADSEVAFRHAVLAQQARFPGLLAVNWIDPKGLIRRVVPGQPNRSALGKDLTRHPVAGAIVAGVQDDGKDRFSPPIDLYQGGRGFTGYLPVHRQGELVAILNPVFRIPTLVEPILKRGDLTEVYSIALSGSDRPVYESLLAGSADWAIERDFRVGDRIWTVALRPGPRLLAAAQTPLADLAGLLGILAAAALAYLIRAQQRASAERAELLLALERRQRLETIGTLAGGVAHEYNNHLAALLGFNEIARISLGNDDRAQVQDCLEQTSAVIERSRQVVEQILTFARRREHVVRQVRALPVLEEIGKLFRTTLRPPIRFAVELDLDPEVVVMGDSGRLHQVLTNLITNASQALPPEGGSVALRARTRELSAAEATRLGLEEGLYLEVAVSDDGAGIPSEVKERIFEPFFTTKDQGTGLGLAVTHGIVQDHKGEIAIDSEPGQGTTFRVILPCLRRELEQETSRASDPGQATVLFVEDEALVQTMVQTLLRKEPYELLTAGSAEEARALLQAESSIQLVLSDERLPGQSGLELFDWARAEGLELPFVLMSGAPSLTEDALLAKGFVGLLRKPFSAQQLKDAIAEGFEAPSSVSPPA
ncbi:MAG TPA: hypothetical protein DEA08_15835 [Planctomycetes bacterium]|nr:hypothetical protein [Planctomycetota bacterium]